MITKLLLVIPAIFVNIETVVIADSVSYFTAFFITQWYGTKCALPSIWPQIKTVLPYFVSSIVAGICIILLLDHSNLGNLYKIIVYSLLFIILYAGMIKLLAPYSFDIIRNLIKNKI